MQIELWKKYLAKRSDEENIKGSGQFITDGSFRWHSNAYVPILPKDYDVLLILDEKEEPAALQGEIFDLNKFREISVRRAKEGFKCYDNMPITFWTTAIAGEVGELCNLIKKQGRVIGGGIDGGTSYKAKDITPEMIKDEFGGIFIYLDLLASLMGVSLDEAIIETFNNKSIELNLPFRYPAISTTKGEDQGELWGEVIEIAKTYLTIRMDDSPDIGGRVKEPLIKSFIIKRRIQ